MSDLLLQITIYLTAALLTVTVCVRFKLGAVLGYLIAGILIGPVLGLVGSETSELQHIAEFGVVMMLFIIGLELEPQALWAMRHRLINLGGLQIVLSALALSGGAYALGFDAQTALVIGLLLSLSSTAIVLQTLSEKGLMRSNGGRTSFSVLLTQDIAVIPMLALIPLFAIGLPHSSNGEAGHGHAGGFSLIDNLPTWSVPLVTLAAVGGVILIGLYLVRPLFRMINRTNLRELHTAFALLLVVGIACLMLLVGLSPALGTFLAGVVLANSEFRHQLESDIEPFKGLLLGLFFITVGAGINFTVLFGNPLYILALTLGVIIIKAFVLYLLSLIFKIRGNDRVLFTLALAQAGEFGFVLIAFSAQFHIFDEASSQTLLLVVALSMLFTPLLFILHEQLAARMGDIDTPSEPDQIDQQSGIIIAGVGRFGQVVNRVLQAAGYNTTVLDNNMRTIEMMRRFGFKSFYGDPTRLELLHAAGLDDANVLIVSVDDKTSANKIVKLARSKREDLHIIARATDRVHVYELYAAGANDIVRETFDSSLRAGRYALESLGYNTYDATEFEKVFFNEDRHILRELAPLWDPDVPIAQNHAYTERAKELSQELETNIISSLQEDKKNRNN